MFKQGIVVMTLFAAPLAHAIWPFDNAADRYQAASAAHSQCLDVVRNMPEFKKQEAICKSVPRSQQYACDSARTGPLFDRHCSNERREKELAGQECLKEGFTQRQCIAAMKAGQLED